MSQCSYVHSHGQQNCPYPVWSNSHENFCLFHDPSKEKPEEEFKKLLKEKLQKNDFNFEGYSFTHSLNLRDCTFPEFVNFENCQFLGRETSFYKTVFKKGCIFNNTRFQGVRVNFSRARLEGDFNLFNGALFEAQETLFVETRFYGKHVGFASTKFSGQRLDFKEADLQGNVFFSECQINSHLTSFEKIKYSGPHFSFSKCFFSGSELRWMESQIQGDKIDFSNCHFESDQIFFDLSRLAGKEISFSNSYFQSRLLSFIRSELDFDHLFFAHTSFSCREVDFSEMKWNQGTADFSDAHFQVKTLRFYPLTLNNKTTNFNRTEFAGDEKTFFILNPQKNDLSFQGVFFHGGRTKLKGDLHAASFIDTSLDNVDLNEAKWDPLRGRFACRDEIDADRVNSIAHYKKAYDVCRSIKQCYENFGSYETAGNFYYGEMECKRKLSSRKKWGGLQFMRLTSGYGEYPVRVIFTSIFLIFTCAFFYLIGGVDTPHGVINREVAFDFSQLSSTIMDFFNCIYFSVVSFTTLGYGDYHPVGWSRVVGASEGFIGAFFMALFVLTIGRKMNR